MLTINHHKIIEPGEHPLTLEGQAGSLEAIVSYPPELTSSAVAIICHPHPLHGGTMHNKVVTTVARTFRDLGVCSIRFNMRGVGNSVGKYDAGIGESMDLLKLIDALPNNPIYLAGFSFGSYVTYRVATQTKIELLISIAPPVSNFDFTVLPSPQLPWIVVQGDADEIIPPDQVYQWLATLAPQPYFIHFPATGHFFHGKLVALKAQLKQAIPEALRKKHS